VRLGVETRGESVVIGKRQRWKDRLKRHQHSCCCHTLKTLPLRLIRSAELRVWITNLAERFCQRLDECPSVQDPFRFVMMGCQDLTKSSSYLKVLITEAIEANDDDQGTLWLLIGFDRQDRQSKHDHQQDRECDDRLFSSSRTIRLSVSLSQTSKKRH